MFISLILKHMIMTSNLEDFEIRSKRMAIRLAHTVAFNEDHCTGVMEGQIRQLHETLTAVDEMGDLPLGNAFLKSHTKSATFLMNLMSEFRIPFNYTNFSGHSFLILLANSQCSESFAPSLIAGDCDVTAKDHLHRNVLHYAVHNKRIGLLNYLLENHRSSHSLLTERDAHNMSPLHLAVFHEDSPQILNICLQYCSDVNHESNVEGETSLFIAMSNSCEKSAMILLKDPRVDVEISCAGRNLLTLAFERKLCAEIADLIRLRKDQASGLTAIINSLERIDINKLAVDKVYETVDSLTISQCHLLGDQIAQTRMLHLSTSDVSRLKSLKITTSDGQSRMMLKSFLKHLNPPVNLALVHQLMMEIIKK